MIARQKAKAVRWLKESGGLEAAGGGSTNSERVRGDEWIRARVSLADYSSG
jgi:hypothetical protein